jgi:hypothetical protein
MPLLSRLQGACGVYATKLTGLAWSIARLFAHQCANGRTSSRAYAENAALTYGKFRVDLAARISPQQIQNEKPPLLAGALSV